MWPFSYTKKENGKIISLPENLQNISLMRTLEREGLLTRDQFRAASKRSKRLGRPLAEILLEDDTLPEKKLLDSLADFYGMPSIFLRKRTIAAQVINLLPKEISEQNSVVIFKKIGNIIHVAVSDPRNERIIEFIRRKTGFDPVVFLTTPRDISAALSRYNVSIREDFAKILDQSLDEAMATSASAEKLAQFVPVIRMVSSIMDKALSKNASDIHIEPTFDKVIIRFRIDGILHKIVELPNVLISPIVARIKILANLKIDEHMLPQDGRFQYEYNNQEVAIRVSIIPTLHGPKIAMRLLELKQRMFNLSKLGLNKLHLKLMKAEIVASHGMILVTGPTGSGKTTTLYTILKMLNKEGVNICTIEDPIEYGLDNINQMQVKPQVGLTFAAGLRALLRQDPNIIMIGEIRDGETANIAVNSAMTGHLVLSTLHTNSAFLAPQRLSEMGIQNYLLSAVLNLLIGQRLVRRICDKCKAPIRSTEKVIENYNEFLSIVPAIDKLKKLELIPSEADLDNIKFYRGKGCKDCHYTGYKGRLGIYEVLKVDEELKRTIFNDPSEESVKKYLTENEAITMAEDGILKVIEGSTTFDEVLRVIKE